MTIKALREALECADMYAYELGYAISNAGVDCSNMDECLKSDKEITLDVCDAAKIRETLERLSEVIDNRQVKVTEEKETQNGLL